MPLPTQLKDSIQQQGLDLLKTGSRFKAFDQVRQRHFWSDLCFLPNINGYINSGNYKAFITPSGQVGQGFPVALTELETNWKSANRVPDNQNFEVLEVGVTIMGLPDMTFSVDDAVASTSRIRPTSRQQAGIQTSSILAIQYLTNEVPIGLCNDFQQASGPTMGGFEASNVVNEPVTPDDPISLGTPFVSSPAMRYITNGFAAPGLRRRFKVPILLQHGETFSFNINIPRSFYFGPQIMVLNSVDYINGYVMRIDFWATESFVEKS